MGWEASSKMPKGLGFPWTMAGPWGASGNVTLKRNQLRPYDMPDGCQGLEDSAVWYTVYIM